MIMNIVIVSIATNLIGSYSYLDMSNSLSISRSFGVSPSSSILEGVRLSRLSSVLSLSIIHNWLSLVLMKSLPCTSCKCRSRRGQVGL